MPDVRDDAFLSVFNFEVVLTPVSSRAGETSWTRSAAFSEVTGLEISVEPVQIREGGYHFGSRVLMGKVTNPPLVLKRGMSQDAGFWTWLDTMFAVRSPLPYFMGELTVRRPDGSRDAGRAGKWRITNALPTKIKLSDLSAKGGTEIAIEELTLAHEGLSRVDTGASPGAAS